jgi:predicted nucleotidyltransferase
VRLSDSERLIVREAVARRFGSQSQVLLFGSRLDDSRRGGDVDLLVELPHEVDDPLTEAVGPQVDVMRALGERKVDVLIAYPGCIERSIHRIARRTGQHV